MSFIDRFGQVEDVRWALLHGETQQVAMVHALENVVELIDGACLHNVEYGDVDVVRGLANAFQFVIDASDEAAGRENIFTRK